MGGKPDNALESNRPESGGADKDMVREKSGLLERDKEKFAREDQAKRADAPEQVKGPHAPFSVGSEPSMERDSK